MDVTSSDDGYINYSFGVWNAEPTDALRAVASRENASLCKARGAICDTFALHGIQFSETDVSEPEEGRLTVFTEAEFVDATSTATHADRRAAFETAGTKKRHAQDEI